MTRAAFPHHRLRFLVDSGLDDQKIFAWVAAVDGEFVIRASHLERSVEVANPRLPRWETEQLQDLVNMVPFATPWAVAFTHAGTTRQATLKVGWLQLRMPETQQAVGAVGVEEYDREERAVRTLVLLTNVPIQAEADARAVDADGRLRGRLEHGSRFDQEQGLAVEARRVPTLARMHRLFALVLVAAQVVLHGMETWPPVAGTWLRLLGGKVGLQIDRDGPDILLRGLPAVWQTGATLTLLMLEPFPHHAFDSP